MTRPSHRVLPSAGPGDLQKWGRLIDAVLAAVDKPELTKPLVKARNATRKTCLMPAGQGWVGSPFHRFSSMSVLWTSLTLSGRRDLAPDFRALAVECRDILETLNTARKRADLE